MKLFSSLHNICLGKEAENHSIQVHLIFFSLYLHAPSWCWRQFKLAKGKTPINSDMHIFFQKKSVFLHYSSRQTKYKKTKWIERHGMIRVNVWCPFYGYTYLNKPAAESKMRNGDLVIFTAEILNGFLPTSNYIIIHLSTDHSLWNVWK